MRRGVRNTRVLIAVTVVLSAALPAPSTEAAELRCTVRSVAGDIVNIGCDGGATARPGDPVRIGFEAPGVGFIALEGSWTVSLVGPGGEVQATPGAGAHGTPQFGHVAFIESSAQAAASGPSAGPGARAPVAAGVPAGPDRSTLPPFAQRPWLGLALVVTADDATSGVTINDLRPGGPAARAGVRAGDVILAVDGVPTPSSRAFGPTIADLRAGREVTLRLLRLPEVLELPVTPELPNLDNPFVQTKIGYDFLNGQEVPVDEQRGVEWLEKAAAQGFGDAIAMLESYRSSAHSGGGRAGSETSAGPGLPVYIAGTEEGNRPGWFELEPAIQQAVTMSGARVGRLPPDIWAYRNKLTSPGEVHRAIQNLGGGWVLWVDASLKVTRFGLGKDRITMQCFDPSGNLQWTREVSNLSGSGKQSLKILSKKIPKKLEKKRGEACLRP